MNKNNHLSIICPKCKSKLLSEDIFQLSNDKLKCNNCNITFNGIKGSYDFTVKDVDEKIYYEKKYRKEKLAKKI